MSDSCTPANTADKKAECFDRIAELLERGYEITITSGPKRMTLNGERDFYLRFSFYAEGKAINAPTIESPWGGYESAEQVLTAIATRGNTTAGHCPHCLMPQHQCLCPHDEG